MSVYLQIHEDMISVAAYLANATGVEVDRIGWGLVGLLGHLSRENKFRFPSDAALRVLRIPPAQFEIATLLLVEFRVVEVDGSDLVFLLLVPDAGGPSSAKACDGFVYFVRTGAAGPIKIGFSRNVSARIADLQTAHHDRLVLLATKEGTEADEQELHRQFSKIRLHGEWFSATPDLLEFIESIKGGR